MGCEGEKLPRRQLNDDSQFINYYVRGISSYIYSNVTTSGSKINLVNVEGEDKVINVRCTHIHAYSFSHTHACTDITHISQLGLSL